MKDECFDYFAIFLFFIPRQVQDMVGVSSFTRRHSRGEGFTRVDHLWDIQMECYVS